MNISDLFSMGGYGVYIWTTYAITLSVFSINLWLTYREQRKIKKTIEAYLVNLKQSS